MKLWAGRNKSFNFNSIYATLGLTLALAACDTVQLPDYTTSPNIKQPESGVVQTKPSLLSTELQQISFNDIPNWHSDNMVGVKAAFLNSCQYYQKYPQNWDQTGVGGSLESWNKICSQLQNQPDQHIKSFFEQYFNVYQVGKDKPIKNKLTSYATPIIPGHFPPCADTAMTFYRYPGQDKQSASPFEMSKGSLAGYEIACADSAIDGHLAQIQGTFYLKDKMSGRFTKFGVSKNNGLEFISLENKAYLGITRKKQYEIEAKSPMFARQLTDLNPRKPYHIKEETISSIKEANVKGSINVKLTPQRSIAIDPKHLPYGVPVWINSEPLYNNQRISRLVFAQDTGGEIKGPARADYYYGLGEAAFAEGSKISSQTSFHIFLPKGHIPQVHAPSRIQTQTAQQVVTKRHGIQLGAFPNQEQALQGIQNKQQIFPNLNRDKIEIILEKGQRPYKIVLGGFTEAPKARDYCDHLKANKIDCFYRTF